MARFWVIRLVAIHKYEGKSPLKLPSSQSDPMKVQLLAFLITASFFLAPSQSLAQPHVVITPPPTIVPVIGPWIRLPVIPDPNWKPGHRGLDIASHSEAFVVAPRTGIVRFADYINGVGSVSISTYDWYRHIMTFIEPLVSKGDKVVTGQQIGWVSESGHCKRTCLHWAVKHFGKYIDPRWLLPSMLVRIKRVGAPG
ncbi:MAG: hypothetical protein RIS09_365 [Actinomycetota bacterium]